MILERHKFNARNQREGEQFQTFLSDIRNKAAQCNFGDLHDELLRDRIVSGLRYDSVRKHLLRDSNLTLAKAIQTCQIYESSEQNAAEFSKPVVDEIKRKQSKHTGTKSSVVKSRTAPRQTPPDTSRHTRTCRNCGSTHKPKQCPAYGRKCNACGKLNHYAKMCRSGKKPQQSGVDEVVDAFYDEFQIETVSLPRSNRGDIHTNLKVNDTELEVKIDTGAKVNVISLDQVKRIGLSEQIDVTRKTTLLGFGGAQTQTVGSVDIPYKQSKLTFEVVDSNVRCLLGLRDSVGLRLVKLSQEVFEVEQQPGAPPELLNEHPELFDGELGTLPCQYKITLDPDVAPVIRPVRSVPAPLRNKVEAALNRLENRGIIAKVTEPTDWVSALVVTAKKDSDDVRICIDPGDLNKAIKRPHHPLKTIEQVVANIPGAKYFTVVDAKEAFYHIPLEENSSYLTTFGTPFGRYRYLRMPMGLCSSSDVYQRAIEQLLTDYPCQIIMDDILISGRTEKEHDDNVKAVMTRLKQINLKLSPHKCKYKTTEVRYVGHVLTDQGLKPDPNKVRAITDMPDPTDVAELLRFMGMVKYLAKFIPNLSNKTAVLNDLLRKNVEWTWEAPQAQALQAVKEEIANATTLAYYDVNRPVTLTCDASQSGLGAACIQDHKVVSFASRAMTDAEKRYSQIEKELLAVRFACNRFRDYVFRDFTVETDHRPLVSIMDKPLSAAPKRLQSMLLQLKPYRPKLVYKAGKSLHLADTMSRAYLPEADQSEHIDFDVLTVVPVTNQKYQELQRATTEDTELSKLSEIILTGWPKGPAGLADNIKPYFAFRDELATDDSIVYRGEKIVVPQSLRAEYIQQVHRGHIGIEATKRRAKDIIYWPGMDSDINDALLTCQICQTSRNHQQKEPLLSYPVPSQPWSIVATDMFQWRSLTYLVTVDSYSGWFELDSLRDTTAKTIIKKLKAHFARFGRPAKLISDNGPPYFSNEFKQFMKAWDIEHVTSSPHHPSSNGLAEKTVQTAKRMLEKTFRDGGDVYLSLLNYRNTPRKDLGSPAQRNISRRTRTIMPTADSLLRPSVLDPETVQHQLSLERARQKVYADRTAKPLPPLVPGDTVRMQTDKGFSDKPATVVSNANARSYIVQQDDNKTYRRNRKHLLHVPPANIDNPPTVVVPPPTSPAVSPAVGSPSPKNSPAKPATPKRANVTPQRSNVPPNRPSSPVAVTRYGRAVYKPARYRD